MCGDQRCAALIRMMTCRLEQMTCEAA